MYNVLPTTWKTQQVPVLGVINNHAVLPQRAQVKEFHSMNKVPEYSPEYRPEAVIMPPTHLGGMDDDKGAIHTIPAPNLSLADKPYNFVESNGPDQNPVDQVSHNQYQNDGQYNSKLPGKKSAFELEFAPCFLINLTYANCKMTFLMTHFLISPTFYEESTLINLGIYIKGDF